MLKKSNLYIFPYICALSYILACDNISEEARICKEESHLCDQLHYDSFCPEERAHLVVARYKTQTEDPELEMALYNELLASEKYRDCIQLKSQIRHVQHKHRETDRTDAYVHILAAMKRIEKATSHSHNPYLAYYHWSRHNNRTAKNNLITVDENEEINDLEILKFLAEIYAKREPMKSISYYKKSLTLEKPGFVNTQTLLQIAHLSYIVADIEGYLVFYLAARSIDNTIKLDNLKLYSEVKQAPDKVKYYDKAAHRIIADIRNKSFTKSIYYKTEVRTPESN